MPHDLTRKKAATTPKAAVKEVKEKTWTAKIKKGESVENSMERWDVIQPILHKYAQLLRKDIYAFNAESCDVQVMNHKDRLYIVFDGVPEGCDYERTYFPEIFGQDLRHTDNYYGTESTGTGYHLIEPTTNKVIAELCLSTLYVLFDLPDGESSEETVAALTEGLMELYMQVDQAAAAAYYKTHKQIAIDIDDPDDLIQWRGFVFGIKNYLCSLNSKEPITLSFFNEVNEIPEDHEKKFQICFEDYTLDETEEDYNLVRKEYAYGNNKIFVDFAPGHKYIRISDISVGPDEERSTTLVTLICEILAEMIPCALKPAAEMMAKWNSKQEELFKVKWCMQMRNKLASELRNAREQLNSSNSSVDQYRERMVNAIRAKAEWEEKVNFLSHSVAEKDDRHWLEYKTLMENPHIKSVKLHNDYKLDIFTDHLYLFLDENGKTYDLGEYRIEIYFDGKVKMFNLTRQINDDHHPHVTEDGRPCLGNFAEAIPDYIASYEFTIAAQVCIEYLQSTNVEDQMGKHIYMWPVVEEKAEEVKECEQTENVPEAARG